MKINFENCKISDSPLSVLRHLYFYTVQYGLSVKQFTGQHWKDWEKLPIRLENAVGDIDKMQDIIKELHLFSAGSKNRQEKRREQMKSGWAGKEIVINAQLISLLSALPPRLISAGVDKLTSQKIAPEYRVVKLHIPKEGVKKQDYDFVEPDLLLLGNNHLVMIEIKTRGSSSSSYSYPARQLFNYIRLAYECGQSEGKLPTIFSHIILVPTVDRQWFYNSEKWIKFIQSGENKKMIVDFDASFKLSGYSKEKYYNSFKKLITRIPLYVRSWNDFTNAFDYAAKKYSNKEIKQHIKTITDGIKELSDKSSKFI